MPDLAKVLCVSPSLTLQMAVAGFANERKLAMVVCESEAEALQHLSGEWRLIVVDHELADGDSFQLLEAIRFSIAHMRVPVAFMLDQADPGLLWSSLQAGATEVFLKSDLPALEEFIFECAAAGEDEALNGRVLLVEYSEEHGEYVAYLCRGLGLEVDLFSSCDSAFEAYAPRKYQLALVDVMLNDVRTGVSLVRSIRHDHREHLPIILMSGLNDLPRRLRAFRSGIDDFISKPFSPEEFIWRVKRVLQNAAALAPEPSNGRFPEHAPEQLMLRLSPREQEICQRVLAGQADKEIARDLGISFWTVRSHIEQIFNKTGALNRRDLMARFIDKAR